MEEMWVLNWRMDYVCPDDLEPSPLTTLPPPPVPRDSGLFSLSLMEAVIVFYHSNLSSSPPATLIAGKSEQTACLPVSSP